MSIARFAIERPLYPWMLILLCLAGGLWGIDTVGRLEDPPYPIKIAYVITPYPGASALEVEQEVTNVIEAALQQLPYLDHVTSKSVPGRSEVQVEVLEHYDEAAMPQIWDELRRRVREAERRLPPGAGTPLVEDDFGDVYGILYAVTIDDLDPATVARSARDLVTGLEVVPGVAKVSTTGEPREAVFVEIDHARLLRLGLPLDAVFAAIDQENRVLPAGSLAFGDRRLRMAPALAFPDLAGVAALRIGRPGSTDIVELGDVAAVTRGETEIPPVIIRHDGRRAFSLGVSITDGENVVEVGRRVDARMAILAADLPVGMEVRPVYRQHVVVDRAMKDFLRNLGLSVATVVGALCLFMGWRAGTVVGSVLLLTVLGTLFLMALLGIELQRISLGALMIAMGMLVDNAIVVAEGMVVGVRRGLTPAAAAEHSVQRTQYALLGATVIGILAFAPIGLSADQSGHFLRSLTHVVAISLVLSWVLAITVVPLLGSRLLQARETPDAGLYRGLGYRAYRALIDVSLRRAWLATTVILAITLGCFYGFRYVEQGFFPSNNTPLFFIDYRLPQGTDIHVTSREMERVEDVLRREPAVTDVTAIVGQGPTRFTAIVRPEQPDPAYAHLIVRVADIKAMDAIMRRVDDALGGLVVEATYRIRRSEFTPAGPSKIEARFSGPEITVLRRLAAEALDIYLAHDLVDRKTDWRARELQIVPVIDATGARMAGVSRGDVYQSLAFATQGLDVGLFREADRLLPIVARAPAGERQDPAALADRWIWSPTQQTYVPASQVVERLALEPADATIRRRDRVRTITAQANAPAGHNVNAVFGRIRADVEAIPLPPGYRLDWGGEYEASQDAERLLMAKIPMTFGLMFLITVLMFGKLRQPLVIWATVPMTVCGVVLSLLATGLSFTFPSFLGFLSLSGMLIKNCVVLVDEIDKRMAEGPPGLDAIAEASVSRLRPVLLAAGTTIAGMSPLLADAFFLEMAVCIMGGLAFATLLTLVAVPVFYRLAFTRTLRRAAAAPPTAADAVTG